MVYFDAVLLVTLYSFKPELVDFNCVAGHLVMQENNCVLCYEALLEFLVYVVCSSLFHIIK